MRSLSAFASLWLFFAASAQADPVHDAVEDYARYQSDVSALLDADIDNSSVDAALTQLRRHDPRRVSRGWIAYGALTAAQAPQFADAFTRSARGDRAEVLRQLREDMTYARRQQAGSGQAIGLILNAAGADGARAGAAGDRFDAFARLAPAPNVRLASANNRGEAGNVRLSPEMLQRLQVGPMAVRPVSDVNSFGGPRFWDSLAGRDARNGGGARGGREDASYASVTDHMLTLAAIVVADAADSESARVDELLDEPLTYECMHMQQLQLRQCLSVSHDPGERAYCMGHHALEGPGGCFANIAR